MRRLLQLLVRAVDAFNRARGWRRDVIVWRQRMRAESFDRWLYLWLHRIGWMGRADRTALARLVRPGATVVDVGSNLGLYTVALSRLAGASGRVLAFEPDPRLLPLLQHNCAANACGNVVIHPLALGRAPGRMTLHTLVVNSGDNHLAAGGERNWRRGVEVEVAALDALASGLRPDVVKIDVQGWELEVLRGMAALIEHTPQMVIYLEYWPAGFRRAGYEATALVDFLTARGFQLYDAFTLAPVDAPALRVLAERLTGIKHVDLVAARRPPLESPIPREQPRSGRGD